MKVTTTRGKRRHCEERTPETHPDGLRTGKKIEVEQVDENGNATGQKVKQPVMAPWPTQNAGGEWCIVLDEAGRGCLAGPMTCAAVGGYDPSIPVHDSKLLKPMERERLFERLVKSEKVRHAIVFCESTDIDELGIEGSWRKGMSKATIDLATQMLTTGEEKKKDQDEEEEVTTIHVVVDGNRSNLGPYLAEFEQEFKQEQKNRRKVKFFTQAVIKADATLWQGAAAGILAKVSKDRHMHEIAKEVDDEFKSIFTKTSGYGSKAHMELVRAGKYTTFHRKSFDPLRTLLANTK